VEVTIINVPTDSSTIQSGIIHASNGCTIPVQPGIYFENIKPANQDTMLADLHKRTGLDIKRDRVTQSDFLVDMACIQIFITKMKSRIN